MRSLALQKRLSLRRERNGMGFGGWSLWACLWLCSFGTVGAQSDEPNWTLEARAAWPPRDSQAEWVKDGSLWIGGGWFNSFEAPPRDVWRSRDGKSWTLVQQQAPWLHSDLPMSLTFKGRLWIMGGWHNGRLPNRSASNQVWASNDGSDWEMVTPSAGWSPRCAGMAIEHAGRIWVLGGTEHYYFGDTSSLKNDVWSSSDGQNWNEITHHAPWQPRGYHQAVSFRGRIFVIGGGNYDPEHFVLNDVWSSEDGVLWQCETNQAPWKPRLWFSAVVYRDKLWLLGGWSKEHGNFGDVWYSPDGREWKLLETPVCWKARHEHSAFVFEDKLWVAGGHAQPLSNEVWSLALPKETD